MAERRATKIPGQAQAKVETVGTNVSAVADSGEGGEG